MENLSKKTQNEPKNVALTRDAGDEDDRHSMPEIKTMYRSGT